MKKKFLSLVLALVMVLGTFGNVFAAAATDKKEVPKLTSTNQKVQWLIDNKIVIGLADDEGKATGNMDLDSPIRRDAVAKMLVYAIGEQDLAAKLQGLYRPFPDVTVDSIVNGYISVGASKSSPANGLPFIEGYNEDGTFRPQREVSYAELAKMLVVMVKKDLTKDMAYKANRDWASTWMRWAAQEGILDGVSVADEHAKAPRSDAFAMIYNAFYKLRDVKPVPTNETRGIISKKSVNYDLVLNQGDFEKKFKVTNETVFVSLLNRTPVLWLENIAERHNYYVGSLVRVLSDKDGNVTHIIEMGNPVKGIQNPELAWVDLGNKTLKQEQSNFINGVKDVELKVDGADKLDKIRFTPQNGDASMTFETTDNTVYYVADYENGVLTQVKDKAAAAKYLGDKTEKVYLAYEVLPKSNVYEAKIVVFNSIKDQADKDIVRVAKPVSNADFMLSYQLPGLTSTDVKQVDLRNVTDAWPYNYKLNPYDVINMRYRDGEFKGKAVLINYKEDPIYQVEDLQLVENGKTTKGVEMAKANSIVLKDKDGWVNSFDLSINAKTFFRNEIVKGAKVQVLPTDDTNRKLAIISVVPDTDSLRGDMLNNTENAKSSKTIEGVYVDTIDRENSHLATVLVNVKDGDNSYSKNETPFVTRLDLDKYDVEAGDVIEFVIEKINNDNAVGEIVKINNVTKTALTTWNKAYQAVAKPLVDDPAFKESAEFKAKLEDAIRAYNALNAEQKAMDNVKKNAGYLQTKIDKYNEIVLDAYS
ncbi:hypothetical protein QO008_001115 [Peptoniphilus ivorii]|uniref:S-layer homology domain-containing protein n=1 Tax=Aedoeadaptatus ivorii TaxID=54006 RepID=UPI002787983F|nr:S-layer homology domain-containing protein [Peptoniphilus ivorii]MDQ0508656.1 hypothetical protein [Peptoniphilus ivorii]